MITLASTINAAGARRARPEIVETELSKLIRYGCQFELEVHQMAELNQLRAENKKLRRDVQNGGISPSP